MIRKFKTLKYFPGVPVGSIFAENLNGNFVYNNALPDECYFTLSEIKANNGWFEEVTEPQFKAGDIVVGIDAGMKSATHRVGKVYQIESVHAMSQSFFVSKDEDQYPNGVWFNSVRLATEDEIREYQLNGHRTRVEKKQLGFEIGKWYLHKSEEVFKFLEHYGISETLGVFQEVPGHKAVLFYENIVRLATPEEVEEAFIKEAKKRFGEIKHGDVFKRFNMPGIKEDERAIVLNSADERHYRYLSSLGLFTLNAFVLCKDGIWAEKKPLTFTGNPVAIIPGGFAVGKTTITLEEAKSALKDLESIKKELTEIIGRIN